MAKDLGGQFPGDGCQMWVAIEQGQLPGSNFP